MRSARTEGINILVPFQSMAVLMTLYWLIVQIRIVRLPCSLRRQRLVHVAKNVVTRRLSLIIGKQTRIPKLSESLGYMFHPHEIEKLITSVIPAESSYPCPFLN